MRGAPARESVQVGRGGSIRPEGGLPGTLLLILIGCGPGSEAGSAGPLPFPVPHSVAGELVVAGGRLAFEPCETGTSIPLSDRTGGDAGRIVDELGYGSGRVLAAVVLDGDDLVEVRHAVPEGRGCRELLPDADLGAWGNEPFWSLRIRGDEARWITPDDMAGAVHSPATWEAATGASPSGWVLTAPATDGWDGEGPGGPLLLRLTSERCVDTMAGSRYPFTARVERDGRTWTGCALEGRGPAAQGNR